MVFIAVNLELRSPTASWKEDLVKFDFDRSPSPDFEHAYRQQGPIYGPYCYCACLNTDIVSLRKAVEKGWISIIFCWIFFGLEDRNDLK